MSEDYPKSLMEYEEYFANDGACLAYLCKLRWATLGYPRKARLTKSLAPRLILVKVMKTCNLMYI